MGMLVIPVILNLPFEYRWARDVEFSNIDGKKYALRAIGTSIERTFNASFIRLGGLEKSDVLIKSRGNFCAFACSVICVSRDGSKIQRSAGQRRAADEFASPLSAGVSLLNVFC